MKPDLKYFVFILLFSAKLSGQIKQFNLQNGNAQAFNGNLYVYGFSSTEKNAVFCIYKLNRDVKIADSLFVPLGKTSTETYLQISSDTIHDYLNIYLQKKEKKLVTVLRFDKNFGLITTIDNIDIARLNSISDFENEIFYDRNVVYTIKNQKDTSGVQFYLNKYTIKSETKNFEYDFTWQFPFERKNVHSAHIFYAGKKSVLLYVNVITGQKSGQWILNINSGTGKLMRGTRLSDKGEFNTYTLGGFIVDTLQKTLLLAGQKFTAAQLKQSENKLLISNVPNIVVYLAEIDSLGDVINKQDFKIATTEPKTTSKKIINNYILRINQLKKTRDGKISFESDIFKNTDNTLVYLYSNTGVYNIIQGDDGLIMEKNTVSSNPLVEKFYVSADKLDMNGKLTVDSIKQFEKLFYKSLTFPVKQQFKTDPDGNPMWILAKTIPKKNTVNYSYLSPVKKIYQLTVIEELPKTSNPAFYHLKPNLFIISRQADEKTYEVKSFNW